jgi:diadenosine tetraphosphate (Ap4A) HIT family hydrolase
MDSFRTKFRLTELGLRDYEHWLVSLHPAQPTVGALVVSLRRPCEHLGELQAAETAELAAVFADLETGLHTTYQPGKVNYLALMMVDAQVHFHVLPRYAESRSVGDHTFADAAWPGPPDLSPLPVTPEDMDDILSVLARALRP